MTLIQTLLLSAFPLLVILAALSDITSFTIPNRISALLIAAFAALVLLQARPMGEIGADAAVFVVALLAGIAMFAMGWIGGGDAKLMAAASLWLGVGAMPVFLVVTALAGGALAVLLLNARSSWAQSYLASGPGWLARLAKPGGEVPYGVAIAAGALAAFPQSALLHGLHGSF